MVGKISLPEPATPELTVLLPKRFFMPRQLCLQQLLIIRDHCAMLPSPGSHLTQATALTAPTSLSETNRNTISALEHNFRLLNNWKESPSSSRVKEERESGAAKSHVAKGSPHLGPDRSVSPPQPRGRGSIGPGGMVIVPAQKHWSYRAVAMERNLGASVKPVDTARGKTNSRRRSGSTVEARIAGQATTAAA